MDRKILIPPIILFSILFIVAISGCTIKATANSTFGEKPPATTGDLYIANSTGNHFDRNNTTYYYVWGYVGNKALKDASNVEITADVFDENDTLIATNNNASLKPETIPTEGQSRFYLRFEDPERKIVRYELKIAIKS
jgi:hypothetical protein